MPFDSRLLEKRLMRALVEGDMVDADRFFAGLIMNHPLYRRMSRNSQERVLFEARRWFRYEVQMIEDTSIFTSTFLQRIRKLLQEIFASLDDIRRGRWAPPYDYYDPLWDDVFGPIAYFVWDDYDDWDYWDDAWVYDDWDYDWDDDAFYDDWYEDDFDDFDDDFNDDYEENFDEAADESYDDDFEEDYEDDSDWDDDDDDYEEDYEDDSDW